MDVSGQLHPPATSPLGKEAPGTDWLGDWVGLRAGLDAIGKRIILHCQESNPGRPARIPSLYRLSYPDSSIEAELYCNVAYFGKQNVKIKIKAIFLTPGRILMKS
jgi:hypothetical protein